MNKHVTAPHIVHLLETRHHNDVFVAECNNGPTGSASYRRLDAWALKRTWSPITMIGYEIKVHRSDFLRDDKWQYYLDVCHEFSFVCPHGMIQPEELPREVGLIWTTKNHVRLLTKRKAAKRKIDLPAKLLVYVLMSRAHIVADMNSANSTRESRMEMWRKWLNDKNNARDLGYRVSQKIADSVREVNADNNRLRQLMRDYDNLRRRIVELGFHPDESSDVWKANGRVHELARIIPNELVSDIRGVANELERLSNV